MLAASGGLWWGKFLDFDYFSLCILSRVSICYQWVILDEHVVTKILHLAQSQVSIKLSVILFPIYVIKITQFRAKIAILSRDLRTVWARSDSDWWDGGDKMYQSKTIILDLNRRNNRMRSSVISDALSLECILETTLLIIMYNSCKCSKNNFRQWNEQGTPDKPTKAVNVGRPAEGLDGQVLTAMDRNEKRPFSGEPMQTSEFYNSCSTYL